MRKRDMNYPTGPLAKISPISCGGAPNFSVDLVIECMRGLAALWVFLFHISDMIQLSIPALYPLALEGYRGVPVFFAISGYCIFAAAQSSVARHSNPGTFLLRRFKRIYPTFWVSIAFVMTMPYVLEAISSFKSGVLIVPERAWMEYSIVDWFGVVTLSKELVDLAAGGSGAYAAINTVYWSLAIEVQFYLIVFLAITLGRYWTITLTLVTIISLLAIGFDVLHLPGFFLHFWPGFLCGVLVRLAHTRNVTPVRFFGRYQIFACGALLFLIAGGCTIAAKMADIGFIESAVLASLVIWCLGGIENALLHQPTMLDGKKIGTVLLFPVVLLGQSSYSLYLLHGQLYQLPEMFIRQLLPATSPMYALLVVLLTSAICYVFYYVIERRFHNSRLPAPQKGTPQAILLAKNARTGNIS